jgi:hypothetical protein
MTARSWVGLAAALAWAGGCGGDICDADLSSAEGEWTFTFEDEDGDETEVRLTIDADGNVDVDPEDSGDDWECEVVQDDLCDLEVKCSERDGNGDFSFKIQRE